MPFSDTAIRAIKPRDKAYKVADEKCQHLDGLTVERNQRLKDAVQAAKAAQVDTRRGTSWPARIRAWPRSRSISA